jgi:hypothetical protein
LSVLCGLKFCCCLLAWFAPKSDTAEPFGYRSRKNSELQTKRGLLCGIVSTLIQTVTNLKTYAFEDLNRIPEVNTAQS